MKKFIILSIICFNMFALADSYSHDKPFYLKPPTASSEPTKPFLQPIDADNVSRIMQVAEIPDMNAVHDVTWSPDGKVIAVATEASIQLYDADQLSRPRLVFEGHTAIVLTVAFSPDGRSIASGSADGTIRIW